MYEHTHIPPTYTRAPSLSVHATEDLFDREITAFPAGRALVGGLRGHDPVRSGPVCERIAAQSSLCTGTPVVTNMSVTIASCASLVTACLSTTFCVNVLHHRMHSISSFLSSIIGSPFIPTPRPTPRHQLVLGLTPSGPLPESINYLTWVPVPRCTIFRFNLKGGQSFNAVKMLFLSLQTRSKDSFYYFYFK